MDTREFEAIKKKIETLKDKRSKATGALESIVAGWKAEYGITTVEEVEKLLASKKADIAENDAILEEAYTKLKGVTNWALV